MRRADREVTDVDGMIDIIDHCKVCHIALMDGEWPYIVAMNFAYRYENDQLVIFFTVPKKERNWICFGRTIMFALKWIMIMK